MTDRTADVTKRTRVVEQLFSECTAMLEQMATRLQRILQMNPLHAGARERLAYVLLQLGRTSEAMEHLGWLDERGRAKQASWVPDAAAPGALPPLR